MTELGFIPNVIVLVKTQYSYMGHDVCVYVCVPLHTCTHIQLLLSEKEHEALQTSKSEEITRRKAEVEMSGADVKLAFTHGSIDKVI